MRRSGSHRWIGLLVGALWCAAIVARPTLLACPMGAHHAMSSDASSGSAPDDAHAAHAVAAHAGAALGGEPGHDASAPDTPTAPSHQSPCDCLGHCCVTAVVVPGTLSSTIAVSYLDDAPTPGRPQHEFVAHWVDFVLPFATAPPSMVTG